jgi:dienelactone hydrolase
VSVRPGLQTASAVAVATLLALAAGCGGSKSGAPAKEHEGASVAPFTYDAQEPLRFQDHGRVNSKTYPIAVRDVSYVAKGRRVEGFIARPLSGRKLAAVIYLHGAGGARNELLLPAVWLAARRAVSLTITAPSSNILPPSGETQRQALARDERMAVADVVAVRRAVDVLRTMPQVDPARIGVVGWSLGAHTAAVVAGVEPRIRAFVLMSGGAVPVSAYLAQTPASLVPAARRTLTAIDPLRWIAHARPGRLLLEDGFGDTVVPRAALQALAKAAPKGTEVRWYRAGHALNTAAYRYQVAWLVRKLGIKGPPVPGAKTGP